MGPRVVLQKDGIKAGKSHQPTENAISRTTQDLPHADT